MAKTLKIVSENGDFLLSDIEIDGKKFGVISLNLYSDVEQRRWICEAKFYIYDKVEVEINNIQDTGIDNA